MTPSQTKKEVFNKITDMLDADVRSCWLVQPAMETITIYMEVEKPQTFSTSTVTDPATDIVVDLPEVFDDG